MNLSVIIPCYNSAKTLKPVLRELIPVLEHYQDYQVILVNDGSLDDTWQVISCLCQENSRLLGLNLSRNYGQHAARMAGLKYAAGDYIVFMDDDGQHPAAGIPLLCEKAEEGFDIVYALFKEKKESLLRRLGSCLNEKMAVNTIGKPADVKQSSFFIIRDYVGRELLKYEAPFVYIFGRLMQITQNIANVQIEHQERLSGSSGYTFKRLTALFMNGFLGFSLNPLLPVDILGCFAGLLAILSLATGLLPTPAGSVRSVCILLFGVFISCSMILLALGYIGRYAARILMTVNKTPQYTIKEIIGKGEL